MRRVAGTGVGVGVGVGAGALSPLGSAGHEAFEQAVVIVTAVCSAQSAR